MQTTPTPERPFVWNAAQEPELIPHRVYNREWKLSLVGFIGLDQLQFLVRKFNVHNIWPQMQSKNSAGNLDSQYITERNALN